MGYLTFIRTSIYHTCS